MNYNVYSSSADSSGPYRPNTFTGNMTKADSKTIFSRQIRAVIFDLDGTLVSSALDFSQIREDIACPPKQDVLSYMSSLSEDKQKQAASIVRHHEIQDAVSARKIMGSQQLLDTLLEMNIKTAIVTRNSREASQIKIANTGLNVEILITRNDAPAKPDPTALTQLKQKWNLEAEECIYVGDYVYDIQAAHRANMHACLYIDGDKEQPEFAKLADFICTDYSQFIDLSNQYLQQKK